MAVTKTLVFSNVQISNGATGLATNAYPLHLTESAEVTITPVNDTVQDGQTIVSAYDVTFSVNMMNTQVLLDPFIYKDASAAPVLARITFKGASGAQTLNIENVYINGARTFDGNRTQVSLSGSKRGVTLDSAVTVV
jgi:hypothetical protein